MSAVHALSAMEAVRLRSAARTDPGCRRQLNEDRFIERPNDGFWAIADGMGGHRGGDAAASFLVEALETVRHEAFGYARLADVVSQVEAVNQALFLKRSQGEQGLSGATLVALLVQDGHYACLWAGDSRAYRLRGRDLIELTHDHSQVQELVDAGLVAEESRRSHPQSHLITRAVGAAQTIDLDRSFGQAAPGDRFLLCSDGLTACLDAPDIASHLQGGDLEEAADALLKCALARGAPDNVTLVVAQVEPH